MSPMTSYTAKLARNLDCECTGYFLTHFAFIFFPLNLGGKISLNLFVIEKKKEKNRVLL